jgi:hypothetical protein
MFGGSEVHSWRKLLTDEKVPTVALSYMGLRRKTSFVKPWLLTEHYPEYQEIFLDSGTYTLNKVGTEALKEHEVADIAQAYMAFASQNADRISFVSEFDALIMGEDWIKAMREDFWNDLDDKFLPIWHSEYGLDELDKLARTYKRVGILQADVNNDLSAKLNSLVNQYGTLLHGVAMTRKDMMRAARWDSVSSMSWLSPSRFGDTIIWTGNELKRYPKAYKERCRKQHRSYLTDSGFDAQKISDDDPVEVLRLSLWSWQKFTEDINRHRVTGTVTEQNEGNTETDIPGVGGGVSEARNSKLLPVVIEQRETQLIPIAGVTYDTSGESSKALPMIEVRSESMRICNTCFLREKCPGYKPNANCLYNIPLEIKTAAQVQALQNSLITMQTQRILFMKMAEDIEGGYADPNLSSEMDRLQRMLKSKAEAEKEGFSLKIEASASANTTGLFTRLLGEDAAGRLAGIEAPVKADDVIVASEIWEAEVLEDKTAQTDQ